MPLQHKLHTVKETEPFSLVYEHKNGNLYQGDSIEWLKSLQSESVNLIFADPPYNINKADWDKFESQTRYIDWSMQWISEASRVLKKDGTLYVCGFSEILADLKHPSMRYFKSCRWIVWYYKNKANLGNDWGRSHESLLHLRKNRKQTFNVDDVRIPYGKHTLKYPSHPQAESSQYGNNGKRKDVWVPHPGGAKPKDVIEVPTTCNGMGETTSHPTQKPEELVRKFVLASSSEGDIVLDPFSGSGTTIVVAEQLNRKWFGCEVEPEYNEWAVNRLESAQRKTKDEWMKFDKANEKRRNSIR
ncbi:DNA-methyltransferase [Candidatus Spongiihabitans sp.]|uniref:DNA-methyltransferase n=1 Tax=Candidatus Spongiihabitans sp. TaxID=3101308 RepID=UPI003C6F0C95